MRLDSENPLSGCKAKYSLHSLPTLRTYLSNIKVLSLDFFVVGSHKFRASDEIQQAFASTGKYNKGFHGKSQADI